MKRKENELYWTEQISEYRKSGETLAQWREIQRYHLQSYRDSEREQLESVFYLQYLFEEHPQLDMSEDLNIDHLMPWSKELPKDCYI